MTLAQEAELRSEVHRLVQDMKNLKDDMYSVKRHIVKRSIDVCADYVEGDLPHLRPAMQGLWRMVATVVKQKKKMVELSGNVVELEKKMYEEGYVG